MSYRSRRPTGDVTLKDIAEAVGKSVAAVSRALNDHHDISPETRASIKQVAEQMGYRPNLMARRLQKQTTDTLGVILPVLSPRQADPFFSELLVGIANQATEAGYDILVSSCSPQQDELAAYRRLVDMRRVDGIIVAQPRWDDVRLDYLGTRDFPHLMVGVCHTEEGSFAVSDDARNGARLLVEHVLQQGHTRIGLVNSSLEVIFSSEFLLGFQRQMLDAGVAVDEGLLEAVEVTQKAGYRAAQRLLSKSNPPTAIIAADDVLALGVMAAVQDQGLEVGRDVAVTGYGDILLAEHAQPPLTTIYRSAHMMGQQACSLLIARLRNEPIAKEHIIFEPALIIRQSSNKVLWL